jgi:hypothetical protein
LLAPPPFFRKSYATDKAQFHPFVGYYHAVIGKKGQHKLSFEDSPLSLGVLGSQGLAGKVPNGSSNLPTPHWLKNSV